MFHGSSILLQKVQSLHKSYKKFHSRYIFLSSMFRRHNFLPKWDTKHETMMKPFAPHVCKELTASKHMTKCITPK